MKVELARLDRFRQHDVLHVVLQNQLRSLVIAAVVVAADRRSPTPASRDRPCPALRRCVAVVVFVVVVVVSRANHSTQTNTANRPGRRDVAKFKELFLQAERWHVDVQRQRARHTTTTAAAAAAAAAEAGRAGVCFARAQTRGALLAPLSFELREEIVDALRTRRASLLAVVDATKRSTKRSNTIEHERRGNRATHALVFGVE